MGKGERDLELFAFLVHALLATGHGLGVVYNFRKRNWDDTAIHVAVMAYDIHSAVKHARRLEC